METRSFLIFFSFSFYFYIGFPFYLLFAQFDTVSSCLLLFTLCFIKSNKPSSCQAAPLVGTASLSCPARMDAVVCSLSRCSLFPSLPAVLSRLAPLAWRVKGAPFNTSTLIYLHIFTLLHFIIQECALGAVWVQSERVLQLLLHVSLLRIRDVRIRDMGSWLLNCTCNKRKLLR